MNTITIPNPICGIYLLKKIGLVVYIGQSIDVVKRIAQHVNKDFDSVEIRIVESERLNSEEALLINQLNPKLNKSKGLFRVCETESSVTLKAWRKRRKISQQAASVLIGVSISTLQKWEQGELNPGGFAREVIRSKCK